MVHLITGYAGKPHVTSASDGALNAGIYGKGKYILNMGEKFAYEIISNNLIKVKSGFAINQGRKIEIAINDYEEVTIDNGLQGMKRCDLIVLRYEKNSDSGIETANLVAIKGTSTDAYAEPVYTEGDILTGKAVDDILLYKVFINGLSIENVESAFTLTDSLMDILAEQKRVSSGMGQQISALAEGAAGMGQQISTLTANMSNLGKSVAEGKQLLATTLSGWGPSPVASDASFEVLNSAINKTVGTYGDNRYNQGYVKGVQDADGRALPGTVNYQSGYNAGVAAADGRALPGTVNYQSGYNAGVAAADGRALPGTVNYQSGYNAGVAAADAQSLASIKNGRPGVTKFGYAITCAFMSENDLVPGKYPTASIYTSGIELIHKFIFGKSIYFIMFCWAGSISWNGWHVIETWYI